MAIVRKLKSLKGAGILADKSPKDQSPEFLRLNLIYGFNGSGKSTLSRIFSCLESGIHHENLPDDCSFEIEMVDAVSYSAPKKLTGLQERVCVFNTDFIERNLQWRSGRANSVFYISHEQADAAADLKAARDLVPANTAKRDAHSKVLAATEKAMKGYRTERAKVISSALHLGNRRYEAGQLTKDYEDLSPATAFVLKDEALEAFVNITRLSSPPPMLDEITINVDEINSVINSSRYYCDLSIGQLVLKEIEDHPSMVSWLKTGHDYHTSNNLDTCLLCGNLLTDTRKKHLASALDDKISKLLTGLESIRGKASMLAETAAGMPGQWPKVAELDHSLHSSYTEAIGALSSQFENLLAGLKEARRAVVARLGQPTTVAKHSLPTETEVDANSKVIATSITNANLLIAKHNTETNDFSKRQDEARLAIRKHFISEGNANYEALVKAYEDSVKLKTKIDTDITELNSKIESLNSKVKSHGPAAGVITKLIRAYLGHGELSIVAAAEGYELHRHGKIVKGQPSEGEKTAIALCYFLSSLESEGRSVKDLIVVIDDPISSLDTKAMNYACTLVRSHLKDVGQLFIFTHNQHCMNEFKKAWRTASKSENGKPAKATLLFLDVKMPEATGLRTASIVEMPAQLRGYDSEYHFLCHKMLEFEAAAEGHSEYWFMMPNVIRRVLEVFLAFKVPGSHPITQKLETLVTKLPALDKTRVMALERLTQVESHSDSLEDLIAHSSMTVEETRDANSAMLAFMHEADSDHTKAIRAQCKAA